MSKRPSSSRPHYPPKRYKGKFAHGGTQTDSIATVHDVKHVRTRKTRFARVKEHFKHRVEAALASDKPKGHYKTVKPVTLFSYASNAFSTISVDDWGIGLTFFTPTIFKHAEAVLWNGKANGTVGNAYADTTIGASHNFPSNIITHVSNSSARFYFKNCSQHTLHMEMYIVKGKEEKAATPVDFFVAWNNAYTALEGDINNNADVNDIFTSLHDVPQIMDSFDVEKIAVCFDPGERYEHLLKGPFNYDMDGSKKQLQSTAIGAPVWMDYTSKGCGTHVFFRIIADQGLVTGTTGTAGQDNKNRGAGVLYGGPVFGQNANNTGALGGISCVVETDIHMTCPDNVIDPVNNKFARYLLLQNLPTGVLTYTDVDYQNPANTGSTDV